MKKILISLLFCNIFAFTYSQVTAGVSFGLSPYKWDRNPTTNSPEYVNRSVGSFMLNLAPGAHITMGGEKFRFITEGYCNYSAFAFDWNQRKGLGAFTYGGLAKMSFTKISLGYGIENTKTELYGRPKEFEDITRKFYTMQYAYLGRILYNDESYQVDQFIKVGFGKNKAMCIEVGYKIHFYFSQLYGK